MSDQEKCSENCSNSCPPGPSYGSCVLNCYAKNCFDKDKHKKCMDKCIKGGTLNVDCENICRQSPWDIPMASNLNDKNDCMNNCMRLRIKGNPPVISACR